MESVPQSTVTIPMAVTFGFSSPRLPNPVRFTFECESGQFQPDLVLGSEGSPSSARRNGKWGLYLKLADNTGGEKLLQESESPIDPMSWSRDGKVLVYTTVSPETGSDIWRLSLTGDKPEAVPFLRKRSDERHPQLSPDGKWIALQFQTHRAEAKSTSGPFPEGAGLIQVSVNGGVFPRWRGDGKELYFLSLGIPRRNDGSRAWKFEARRFASSPIAVRALRRLYGQPACGRTLPRLRSRRRTASGF
jgi:hypothetical protein